MEARDRECVMRQSPRLTCGEGGAWTCPGQGGDDGPDVQEPRQHAEEARRGAGGRAGLPPFTALQPPFTQAPEP
eukprot:2033733-Rhodomonas_salina.1